MTTLTRKQFSFDVNLQEAYKTPEGKMHVVGVASDDEEDRTGDRMSTKAIRSMAMQANKGALPLLDNHKSTFGFGHTYSAQAKRVKGVGGKVTTQFIVDFELKDHYPQSKDLFDEVAAGGTGKQLSIGGFLNLKNPKAVKFEENAAGKVVRVLDDILLEHVATTRPGHAAVPRTKFVNAIVKDIFGDDDDLPIDWQESAGQKIADAVESGTEVGTVEVDGEEMNFEVSGKREGDSTKRDVIVVLVDRNKEEKTVTTTTNTSTETAEASTDGVQQEKAMTATTPKEATAPADGEVVKTVETPKVETPKVDPAVAAGLEAIARIGKAFGNVDEEKDEEITEISDLIKSWDAVRAKTLTEKSLDAVRRVHAGMLKLLAMDGHDDTSETVPSVFALKSEDIEAIAAAVAKSLKPETAEGDEAEKTNEDVIKTFGEGFSGLTTELAKGLTEMAGGFQELVSKEVGAIKTQLETTEKSADARLVNLEKAAGVRQSAPGQDAQVATGANPTEAPKTQKEVVKARRPDGDNPFRGMFDQAKNTYMASHR